MARELNEDTTLKLHQFFLVTRPAVTIANLCDSNVVFHCTFANSVLSYTESLNLSTQVGWRFSKAFIASPIIGYPAIAHKKCRGDFWGSLSGLFLGTEQL